MLHSDKNYCIMSSSLLFTSKLQSIEANARLLQEDFSPPAASTTQHLQLDDQDSTRPWQLFTSEDIILGYKPKSVRKRKKYGGKKNISGNSANRFSYPLSPLSPPNSANTSYPTHAIPGTVNQGISSLSVGEEFFYQDSTRTCKSWDF
nr:PREDICTED: uncharacterized protein LOC108205055 isoform X2 [Daucus carota subsp. sativus]